MQEDTLNCDIKKDLLNFETVGLHELENANYKKANFVFGPQLIL